MIHGRVFTTMVGFRIEPSRSESWATINGFKLKVGLFGDERKTLPLSIQRLFDPETIKRSSESEQRLVQFYEHSIK